MTSAWRLVFLSAVHFRALLCTSQEALLCGEGSGYANLDMSGAQETINTLGLVSPTRALKLSNIGSYGGSPVDLVITALGTYDCVRPEKNGKDDTQHFGRINVATCSDNNTFKFQFERLGSPFLMEGFWVTWFDLDSGADQDKFEVVRIYGHDNMVHDPGALFRVTNTRGVAFPSAEIETEVAATEYGGRSNNPDNPTILTDDQRRRAVSFHYTSTSEFHAALSVRCSPGVQATDGRNFLFGFHSALTECGAPIPAPTPLTLSPTPAPTQATPAPNQFPTPGGAVLNTPSPTQAPIPTPAPTQATPAPTQFPTPGEAVLNTPSPTQAPIPTPAPTQATPAPTQVPTQFPTFALNTPSPTPAPIPTKDPNPDQAPSPTRATVKPYTWKEAPLCGEGSGYANLNMKDAYETINMLDRFDSHDRSLKLSNIGSHFGSPVDLVITALGTYECVRPEKNGKDDTQQFGQINVRTCSNNNTFKFQFERLGSPFSMEGFWVTFFDLGSGAEEDKREVVRIYGHDNMVHDPGALLRVTNTRGVAFPSAEIETEVAATAYGGHGNNLDNPMILTDDQRKRAVSFHFSSTSEFHAALSVQCSPGVQATDGRNFFFGFHSGLTECGAPIPAPAPLTLSPTPAPAQATPAPAQFPTLKKAVLNTPSPTQAPIPTTAPTQVTPAPAQFPKLSTPSPTQAPIPTKDPSPDPAPSPTQAANSWVWPTWIRAKCEAIDHDCFQTYTTVTTTMETETMTHTSTTTSIPIRDLTTTLYRNVKECVEGMSHLTRIITCMNTTSPEGCDHTSYLQIDYNGDGQFGIYEGKHHIPFPVGTKSNHCFQPVQDCPLCVDPAVCARADAITLTSEECNNYPTVPFNHTIALLSGWSQARMNDNPGTTNTAQRLCPVNRWEEIVAGPIRWPREVQELTTDTVQQCQPWCHTLGNGTDTCNLRQCEQCLFCSGNAMPCNGVCQGATPTNNLCTFEPSCFACPQCLVPQMVRCPCYRVLKSRCTLYVVSDDPTVSGTAFPLRRSEDCPHCLSTDCQEIQEVHHSLIEGMTIGPFFECPPSGYDYTCTSNTTAGADRLVLLSSSLVERAGKHVGRIEASGGIIQGLVRGILVFGIITGGLIFIMVTLSCAKRIQGPLASARSQEYSLLTRETVTV